MLWDCVLGLSSIKDNKNWENFHDDALEDQFKCYYKPQSRKCSKYSNLITNGFD